MKTSWSKTEKRNLLFSIIILFCIVAVIYSVIKVIQRKAEQKSYEIWLIPKVIDEENDFWKLLIEGSQVAAKEYGVNLTIKAPDAEDNHAMQNEILSEALKAHPDAVVLTPTSYTEVTEAAKALTDAKIPLVLVDSTLDQDISDAVIQTNNIEAGAKMAQCLEEFLPADPVIGIVAHVKGSSTAIERENGFREALSKYDDHIVETVFSDSDYERGYAVTKQLLEEHPDINVLIGLNEYSAVSAARAVTDAGMTGKIVMVGFDSSVEEIQYLESGILKGIVVQKPFNMGYFGVQTAVEILHGKTVDHVIDSGSSTVTKDNMYNAENQKLLFSFRGND